MKYNKQFILDRINICHETGCWEWRKSRNPRTGYGQVGKPPYTAHRVAFEAWYGLPKEKHIRHLCHNKACCNPEHLREGSPSENYADSAEKHMAAAMARRGGPAKNRIPVTVRGVVFPSKLAAIKALKISPYTLETLISS